MHTTQLRVSDVAAEHGEHRTVIDWTATYVLDGGEEHTLRVRLSRSWSSPWTLGTIAQRGDEEVVSARELSPATVARIRGDRDSIFTDDGGINARLIIERFYDDGNAAIPAPTFATTTSGAGRAS